MSMAVSLPVAERPKFLALIAVLLPRWELLPAYAARLCAVVFCADFLTMFLMNVARLKTAWLPLIFFGFFGIAAFWYSAIAWFLHSNPPTFRLHNADV